MKNKVEIFINNTRKIKPYLFPPQYLINWKTLISKNTVLSIYFGVKLLKLISYLRNSNIYENKNITS